LIYRLVLFESLIILGEHLAENGVDHTEDHRMGHRLNNEGLSGREGEEDSGGEEDKENRGNNDVEVDHFVY
jgi:hypothetical protein